MICKICKHEFDEGKTPKNKVICPQCGAYANDKQNVLLDILCFFLNIFAWIPYLILRKKHPKMARGCLLWGVTSLFISFIANSANPYKYSLGAIASELFLAVIFSFYWTILFEQNKNGFMNPIVKCTNKLCGKVISSDMDQCPYCGTPLI